MNKIDAMSQQQRLHIFECHFAIVVIVRSGSRQKNLALDGELAARDNLKSTILLESLDAERKGKRENDDDASEAERKGR